MCVKFTTGSIRNAVIMKSSLVIIRPNSENFSNFPKIDVSKIWTGLSQIVFFVLHLSVNVLPNCLWVRCLWIFYALFLPQNQFWPVLISVKPVWSSLTGVKFKLVQKYQRLLPPYSRLWFYCRCSKMTALLLTLESLGFDSLLGFRNSHKQLPNHRAEIILIQIRDIGRLLTTFSILDILVVC